MVNFGFLGQLAESHPRDVIFTVEYSARTAMKWSTPCWTSSGACRSRGARSTTFVRCSTRGSCCGWREAKLPAPLEALLRYLTGVQDLEKTEIGELLRDYGWIGELGDDEITVAIHKNPSRVTRTVL